jgi:hypothetical protein
VYSKGELLGLQTENLSDRKSLEARSKNEVLSLEGASCLHDLITLVVAIFTSIFAMITLVVK